MHASHHTCSPFTWTAVIEICRVFGYSVKSSPPLLESIRADVGWNICDSVFCIRGAKRDPIHTSLTRCVLKRLLSTRHKTAEGDRGPVCF